MNAAAELLYELDHRGVAAQIAPSGNISLTPKALVTPALLNRLREHKAAVLELLAERSLPAVQPEPAPPPPLPFVGAAEPDQPDDAGVDSRIAAQISAIQNHALRVGWSKEELWGTEFWPKPELSNR